MVIFQIVPRLPPNIDGMGDYALNLACQLYQDHDVKTHFIICDPSWTGTSEIAGFPITQVNKRSVHSLLLLLPNQHKTSNVVLLNYVGYAYARKGCPLWLIKSLEFWKTLVVGSHLVTMFHGTYAFGPPWKSAFWLSPLQKSLADRLVKISDSCLTNTQLYAKTVWELSRGKHARIPIVPVFSNIKEPESVLPLIERRCRLVVFGNIDSRLRIYLGSLATLHYACQLLSIEEIWDIGPLTGLNLSEINGVSVVEIGIQPAEEISAIFSSSLAGFMNYNPNCLAISSVFASYCAHGLLPINANKSALTVDGIKAGNHYWVPDDKITSLKNVAELQVIATNAYTWYQTHNLSIQAKLFASLLVEKSTYPSFK